VADYFYCTVNVTVVVCTSEPDVAVTVIVDVPAGVPVGGGGVELLPHPAMVIASSAATVMNVAGAKRRCRLFLPKKINPNKIVANARVQSANCGVIRGARLAEGGKAPRAVVAMERVVVAAVAPGVTLVGLNVALDADGNPEAEKEIAFGKPPVAGVAEIVKVAVCPAVMVAEEVGAVRAKSIPVPVSVTVCVDGDALSVSVRVAGPNDPVDGGVKVMLMMQVPPLPEMFAPFVQVVPEATAKVAAFVPVMVAADVNVRVAPPLFVTAMDCAALVVFTP
jgi:hypothetical protein